MRTGWNWRCLPYEVHHPGGQEEQPSLRHQNRRPKQLPGKGDAECWNGLHLSLSCRCDGTCGVKRPCSYKRGPSVPIHSWGVSVLLQKARLIKGTAAFSYKLKQSDSGTLITEVTSQQIYQISPLSEPTGVAVMEAR